MNNGLDHIDICKLITEAQTIIATLLAQNKVEIPEEYYLRKAYGELQEVLKLSFISVLN